MDALRVLSVAVSLSEVCVLMAYYIPLASDVPFWQWVSNSSSVRAKDWDDDYVSDLLFKNLIYSHLVTSLVGIHLAVCAAFVYRLNSFNSKSYLLVFELLLMVVAWMGWAVLTAEYQTANGGVSMAHFAGTAMFISCSALYFLLMAYNVYYRFPRKSWSGLDKLVCVLAVASFLLSVAAGIYFVCSAVRRAEAFGWLFEHAAFVLFGAAHLFLFVLEGLLAAQCCCLCEGAATQQALMRNVRITEVSISPSEQRPRC